MAFDDAELAAIYDEDNPDGPDHDFFRSVADECSAQRIVDVGCGTGILTVTLIEPGRRVVGVDPAPAMLDVARHRPGGAEVEWVLGTAEALEPDSADLAMMSGNVAMHLIGDVWHRTLQHIASALVPGGRLVFESRNPEARAWAGWAQPPTERMTSQGPLVESTEVDGPDAEGVVVMRSHNEFLADGAVVDTTMPLQFRSHATIVEDLSLVGLRVVACHRNWAREPFTGGADQPLMVFEAERA